MLQFKEVEAKQHDTVIFPAINLVMQAQSIVAIHSNVTIREQLIKMLQSETKDYNGDIIINEHLLSTQSKNELKIFRLHEGLYDQLTVQDTIQFMKRMTNNQTPIEQIIKNVGLEIHLSVKNYQLTFSKKKRLQLAILLLFDVSTYIFEEPDQNLDIESRQIFVKVMNQLKDKGKTVCILTSNMESAVSFADEVYRLTDKGLLQITMEDEQVEDKMESSPISTQPIRLEKIPTKIEDQIVLFDPLEIDYIESYEGTAFLYINGESFPTVSTLQELEAKLIPFGFFRCHRSYIINLQKVREVITWTRNSYSLTLDDKGKTTIPLSKAKLSMLKEMLRLNN